VQALGKHTERYGRKVSDLRESMVAGLRHWYCFQCPFGSPLDILKIKPLSTLIFGRDAVGVRFIARSKGTVS